MINQTLEQFDLDRAVTVACSTQNPDVPSGNIFVVKTRYCLMWAPGNSTRLVSTCTIEWSGKSWLKGPIEKGANDGQLAYARDLVAALRGAVTVKERLKSSGFKGKGKGGRRKKESLDASSALQNSSDGPAEAKTKEPDWGLFEPLRGPLGPLASLISPTIIIAVLGFMVIFQWWRQPGKGTNLGYSGLPTPGRVAAYDEIWRQEESDLWKWLEERVGLDGSAPAFLNQPQDQQGKKVWLGEQRVKEMEQRLVSEEMSERQMMEAIKVTRERLEALEEAVQNKHKKVDEIVKEPAAGGEQQTALRDSA